MECVMPLVLSLREGQDFYVAEDQFVVDEIRDETDFTIRHAKTKQLFDVTDAHAVEILPDVLVSAGDNAPSSMVRVTIDAPEQILVLRGDKYRNPPAHVLARQH
jgi:hypothetical protein